MSDNGSIILTPAQRAQFEIEMDAFADQLSQHVGNPVLGVFVRSSVENAKATPEATLETLIRVGREITEAVQRIHVPPILSEGS